MSQQALRAKRALLGAITADVATMPLHWIYGMENVRAKLGDGDVDPAFFPEPSCPFYNSTINPGHYSLNQPSPYGEEFLCLLKHMAIGNAGDFTTQERFAQDLERWCESTRGRLNHCSKEFMENRKIKQLPQPQGAAKDAQMNSVVKAVILAVRYAGEPEMLTLAEQCIRVHQNDDMAVACGLLACQYLEQAILHGSIDTAGGVPSSAYAEYAKQHCALDLQEFMDQLAKDNGITPAMYASSCGLPHAFTTCLYFLERDAARRASQQTTTTTYADLIRDNIRFGGDNCSRAIFLGAIKAALEADKVGDWDSWTKRVEKIEEIEAMADVLIAKRAFQK